MFVHFLSFVSSIVPTPFIIVSSNNQRISKKNKSAPLRLLSLRGYVRGRPSGSKIDDALLSSSFFYDA